MSRFIKLIQHASIILVVSITLLAFPSPVTTQSGCPATYRVRWGDTLYSIARRHGATVSTLMEMNVGRIWSPHVIYAGQVICVPGASTPPQASQVAIEATYSYPATDEEIGWNLVRETGQIGIRDIYPLELHAVDTVSNTEILLEQLNAAPPPALMGVKVDPDDETSPYILVFIGDVELITALAITDITPIEDTFPQTGACHIPKTIGVLSGGENTASMTLWLEANDGLRFPFPITHIDYMKDTARAKQCYGTSEASLALTPVSTATPNYRITLVLVEGSLGPPGGAWLARCSSWKTGGQFYTFLRGFYGCPP